MPSRRARWAPTFGRGMKCYNNVVWTTPVFHDAPGGNTLDMSLTIWHADYTMRRKMLVSDKAVDGRAFAYASRAATGTTSLLPRWVNSRRPITARIRSASARRHGLALRWISMRPKRVSYRDSLGICFGSAAMSAVIPTRLLPIR
jgi:hypothetical protein